MTDTELPPVEEVTPEEGWEILERYTQRRLGLSAREFLRRLDAGELDVDGPEHGAIMGACMLLPFVRERRA